MAGSTTRIRAGGLVVPAPLGIFILIVTGALLIWSLVIYESTAADASHTAELLSRVQQLQNTLEDLETAQRGFLITGAERYLAPYSPALARTSTELRQLRAFASDDPNYLADIDRISTLTAEKISEVDQTIRVRREKGEDAAREIVLTDRGLRSMNEIRRLIERVQLDASNRLSTRAAGHQKELHRVELAAFCGLLLGLMFISITTQNIARAKRLTAVAEEERKQQEGEFQQLCDSMPQLAWMAHANGWLFWYNRRWFEFTGTTPDQMEGWGWKRVHDPDILPQVLERWNASIATGEAFEMEFPLRGADGRFRSFLTRVIPLKNRKGEVARWFGTNTDITERVEAERDMAQYAAIVESSQDAIVGKSLDGSIISWNAGAEKLYGYSKTEVVGQPMQMLFPPEKSEEEEEILRSIRRGERVNSLETTRVTRAGEEVIVSLTVSPIHTRQGEIIGASHIARDITERKEFESRMLENQKLESLGVLAGGIAHDFNNLLTGIMGNASLLTDLIPDAEATRDSLAAVISASERAAALTRQLLAYAGKGQFVIEAIDLSERTEQITQLVEASIPRKVNLLLELSRDLPLVEGDVSQLQQVIMNLVINGAEAVGDKIGTVTVRTWAEDENGQPLGTAFPNSIVALGTRVVLEVIDTGVGMSPEILSKIFDPFFTTKFLGRGLGLAAVQGIVRSHRGTLNVSSTPGQGSRFAVSLPAAPKTVKSPVEEPAISELTGRGHVLVVEDEQVIQGLVRSVLDRHGYSVESAYDGQAALDIFVRNPWSFDLVLLDLTMPVMNGQEAFQKLQAIRPGVPILVTSGYDATTALHDFTGNGLAGFIQKPYTAAQLAEKLREALSGNSVAPSEQSSGAAEDR